MIDLKIEVGEDLSYPEIEEMFPDIVEHGPFVIGEQSLCCKIPSYPEYVWSFILTGMRGSVAIFTLSYKYDGK